MQSKINLLFGSMNDYDTRFYLKKERIILRKKKY